ncbi:TonB-dependent receptor plug domain-containing protein [Fulvivirgaceae bacterium PWU37]|uniref:TonB-dependent receptor plug domain-containing protein n=2 Tax=Dawidia soli TaxID=2782352 RepID=A0AAP2DDF8_9BACT|nr:TonB-dependent receptor plug domain-containing protein [Dawidia soli]
MQSRQILLMALLCVCGIFAQAQTGSVRGTILDKTGEPAIGLMVKIQDLSLGAVTDHAGAFVVEKVTPGKHTLLVTGIGFQPIQHTIHVTAGSEVVVSLTAESSSTELEEVMVMGRSEVQETNRQAYNVTAVDAKQLYNTTLDLAGALDRVAGVRVRESGGVGSSFNLSLNGFSGNHVRFFIDGIPMDGFGSSFQINNIPINSADRIEVYKGVVPISLASDALGGAINIITNDRYRNYVDVSYSYGSFNTHRSVINAAATSERGLQVQLSAYQNYSDNDYKVKVDAADIWTGAYTPGAWVRRFHDKYHNEALIAQVGVVKKKYADKLLVGITLGRNYKEIQTGARMVSVFGGWHRRGDVVTPTFKYRKQDLIKGLDVTLNANYNLGSEQNIDTMNVRYDWYGNSKPNGTSGERSRSLYKYKNNTGVATAMASYRINERHSVAMSDVFNTFDRKGSDKLNPDATNPPSKTQKNVLGLSYAYSKEDAFGITFISKFITQKNVISAQEASATTDKLGYGVVGTYFFSSSLQVKASYELTNRMPEAQEIFGDVENFEGNPNLLPEQSDNINVGLAYTFAIDADNKFLLNANGVYRYSRNFIYNRLNNNQSRLIPDNREGVRTYGGDAELRYSHKRLVSAGATLTYQYLQNMQKIEPGYTGVSPVYLDQMPNIPYLFGNADVSVSLRDVGAKGNNLSVGYNMLYVHAFYLYWPSRGSDKLDIPQQLSHDVNLVYSLKQGRYNVGLEARNITDVLLYDNFSLQKPGRGFYINVRAFFHKNNT